MVDAAHHIAFTNSSGSSRSNSGRRSTRSEAKRARVEAAPTWLKGRVEKAGEPSSLLLLPVVEIDRSDEVEEWEVVEGVIKRMKKELFMELMGMMG